MALSRFYNSVVLSDEKENKIKILKKLSGVVAPIFLKIYY